MKYPQSQKIKSFPNTKRSISNLILLITSTKKIDNLQKINLLLDTLVM